VETIVESTASPPVEGSHSESTGRFDPSSKKGIRKPVSIQRFEPVPIDPKITDPRSKVINKGRFRLKPSKKGIAIATPLLISDARFLRNLYSVYSDLLRQCQGISTFHEYRDCVNLYHEIRRLFRSAEELRSSENVKHSMKVVGMTLRLAKREQRSRDPVYTESSGN